MKIKPVQLAEISKSSKANISQQIKQGKLILGDDKKIDTENKINVQWLLARGINSETLESMVGPVADNIRQSKVKNPKGHNGKTKTKVKPEKELPQSELNQEQPINVSDFEALSGLPERMAGLTISQLVMKYGGPMQLKGYVDILNTLMSAMKRDVDIQEKRRALIEKDFVQAHLFQFLDVMINQMFDYPESAIDEMIAEIKADEKKARLKIPEKMRKDFSKIINESKKNITRQIKKLQERHDESDSNT